MNTRPISSNASHDDDDLLLRPLPSFSVPTLSFLLLVSLCIIANMLPALSLLSPAKRIGRRVKLKTCEDMNLLFQSFSKDTRCQREKALKFYR